MSDNRNPVAAKGWEVVELLLRPDSEPQRDYVVSDFLEEANSKELIQIKKQLRLLAAAGIPPDQELTKPDIEPWIRRCKWATKDSEIWVLKCKPSRWRIYFLADPASKRAVALLTVSKKRDDRNTEDFEVCCKRIDRLAAGSARRIAISWID